MHASTRLRSDVEMSGKARSMQDQERQLLGGSRGLVVLQNTVRILTSCAAVLLLKHCREAHLKMPL